MKPIITLVSILAVLVVVSWGGYVLGQRGAESVPEVKAGLSDLASAVAKIDGEVSPDEAYGLLLQYHECWPKLDVNDPGFSDSEKMAMTMVTFGGLLSMNPSILGSLDEAMQKCASLN